MRGRDNCRKQYPLVTDSYRERGIEEKPVAKLAKTGQRVEGGNSEKDLEELLGSVVAMYEGQ